VTRGNDRPVVRRIGLLAVLVLLVLAAVLASRACGDDPTPSPDADGPDAAAPSDASPPAEERTRQRVGDSPTEPDAVAPADGPTAETSADAVPATVTEVSPPWCDLALARHEVEGRVVAPDGTPREGVVVHLVSTWLDGAARHALLRRDMFSRHLVSTAESAADGTFRVEYVEGGDRLLVAGEIEKPLVVAPVTPGELHELVVPAEHRTLPVTVLDAAGQPVPSVHVWGSAALPWSASPLKSTIALLPSALTGDDGVARLGSVPIGSLELRVHRQGSTEMPQTFRARLPATGDVAVTVQLRREVPVRGRVVDAATGDPVKGAFAKEMERMAVSGFTDAEGRFTLPMPLEPSIARTFEVEAPGYAPQRAMAVIREAPGDDTVCDVEIRLHRTASLRLRCVDERGEGLELLTVIARAPYLVGTEPIRTYGEDVQAVPSARGGRVFLERIHPGDDLPLQLIVVRAGAVVLEQELAPLRPGEERDIGDVVIAGGRTLRGTVRDADGAPIVGALVVVVPRNARLDDDARRAALVPVALTGEGRRSETGADGAFAVSGLPPGLCDVLVVRPRPGRLVEALSVSSGSDPAPLDVRLPRTVTVRGRVLRADGTPAARATVLHPLPGPVDLNALDSVPTDDDGRFEIPGVASDGPPLLLRVLPNEESTEATDHQVERSETETVIRLE
jgi:protocatechuate 3,4-dioxygenase beta subunit